MGCKVRTKTEQWILSACGNKYAKVLRMYNKYIGEEFPDYLKGKVGLDKVTSENNIPENLPKETKEAILNTLRDLKDFESRYEEFKKNLTNNPQLIIDAHNTLKDAFSAEDRMDFTNYIARKFSEAITTLQKGEKLKGKSRSTIANGMVDIEGNLVGGQKQIFFDIIYNDLKTLRDTYSQELSAPNISEQRKKLLESYIDKLTLMLDLDVFKSLCIWSKPLIRDYEGIRLGQSIDYADEFVEGMTAEELESIYVKDESTRESWQEVKDAVSAYKSVGKETRKALSTIPLYVFVKEENFPTAIAKGYEQSTEYSAITRGAWFKSINGIGMQKTCNALEFHQYLVENFKGAKSSSDLIYKMKEALNVKGENTQLEKFKTKNPSLEALVEYLESHEREATALYVDLKKNFQEYSDVTYSEGKFKTFMKNRKSVNNEFERYCTTLQKSGAKGNRLWNGNLNIDLQTLKKFEATLNRVKTAYKNLTNLYKKSSRGEEVGWASIIMDIYNLCEYMGLDNSEYLYSDITAMLTQPKLFRDYVNNMTKYAKYAIKDDYDVAVKANESTIKNIIKIIYKSKTYKVEKKVFGKDRNGKVTKYFSDVLPCWMGDMFDEIHAMGTTDELQKWLQKRYFNPTTLGTEITGINRYFMSSNNFIYHRWLRDMDTEGIPNGLNDVESFAQTFAFHRMLGFNDKPFEKLSAKEQTLANIGLYFAREQQLQKATIFITQEEANILEGNDSNEKDKVLRNHIYGGSSDKKSLKGYIFNVENTGYALKFDDYSASKGINFERTTRTTGNFPVFILGDSGCAKYITARRYSKNEIVDELYNVYLQERERVNTANKVTNSLKNSNYKDIQLYGAKDNDYKKNSLKPQYLTYLSKEHLTGPVLSKEDFKTLTEQFFKKSIDEYENIHMKTMDTGSDLEKAFESSENFRKWSDKVIELNTGDDLKAGRRDIIEDYWINNFFATIEQLQMMTIDPAFYDGTKVLQKRYKEIHAPGSEIDVDAIKRENNGKDYETVLYFKDISTNAEETDPDFMYSIIMHYTKNEYKDEARGRLKDAISNPNKKITDDELKKWMSHTGFQNYKSYRKNSITDGQGYRTLKSYRDVMLGAGKWKPEHEDAYNKILALRNKKTLDNKDLREIEELAVVFMPIKPYMYTHEVYAYTYTGEDGTEYTDTTLIPVQHKYSEAVLIPELLPKSSKLREIAEYMEDKKNNIDMVCSSKCVKVGEFGTVDINISEDEQKKGITIASKLSTAYKHNLSYTDYRIQTNVPEHVHASNLQGTQQRKLIMAGIKLGKEYNDYAEKLFGTHLDSDGNSVVNIPKLSNTLEIKKFTGSNVIKFYNELIISNIVESFKEYARLFDDPKTIQSILIENFVNNDYLYDHVQAFAMTGDYDFLLPLFEGTMEHDSAATLLSIFKKKVNKQKMLGGSAVQVGCFGIDKLEYDSNNNIKGKKPLQYVVEKDSEGIPTGNILYAECEIPFNFSYTDANGSEIKLKYEDYCDENGEFIKDEDGNLKIEKEFPGMLDLVAYRIPTERDYSMMNLKVVRCSKAIEGGTIKVPAPSTTVAGFDFDIDKLYLMRKQFDEKVFSYKEFNIDDDTYKKVFSYIKSDPKYEKYIKKYYNEEALTSSQKWTIFENIYKRYPAVEAELRYIRNSKEGKGSKTHLNSYWNESSQVKKIAASRGMTTQELKKYLVNDAMERLGIEPVLSENAEYTWKNIATSRQKFEIIREVIEEHKEEFGDINLRVPEGETRWDSYDHNKVPWENSRTARNNILLELTKLRLTDSETMSQRTTPGGFANASRSARVLRELLYGSADFKTLKINSKNYNGSIVDYLESEVMKEGWKDPEPNYNPCDPMTMIIYNQQNQVAGALIGIFANQNTNHALSSLLGEFTFKDAIHFGDHCTLGLKDLLHTDLSDEEKEQINLNVAEFLAASVDAVKDPTLNFLNYNTITADSAAVLSRLGYSTTEIGLLMNQPVIKKLCEYITNNNVSLDTAIRVFTNEFFKEVSGKVNDNFKANANKYASTDVLIDAILKGKDEKFTLNGNEQQAYILQLFTDISAKAREVGSFVNNTKFTASNAVGSTPGDFYYSQKKVEKYIESVKSDTSSLSIKLSYNIGNDDDNLSPLSNSKLQLEGDNQDDIFDEGFMDNYVTRLWNNPLAYEQCMYDMNKALLKVLNDKVYPYDNQMFTTVRNTLHDITRYGVASADLINLAHKELTVYLLCNEGPNVFTNLISEMWNNRNKVNTITPKEYLAEKIFNRVMNDSKLANSPLFSTYLVFSNDTVKESSESIRTIRNISPMEGFTDVKNQITEAIEELYDNPDTKDLAEELFMYGVFKAGFDWSTGSFMSLMPVAISANFEIIKSTENVKGTTYNEWVKSLKERSSAGIEDECIDFLKKFILNHTEQTSLVFTPYADVSRDFNEIVFEVEPKKKPKPRAEISINPANDAAYSALILSSRREEEGTVNKVAPCIKIKDRNSKDDTYYYYILKSSPYKKDFNTYADGETLEYIRVNELGVTGRSVSYWNIPNVSSENKEDNEESKNTPVEDGNNTGNVNILNLERTASGTKTIRNILSGIQSIESSGNLTEDEAKNFNDAKNLYESLIFSTESSTFENLKTLLNKVVKSKKLLIDAEGNVIC